MTKFVVFDLDGCLADDRRRRPFLPVHSGELALDASDYDEYHKNMKVDDVYVGSRRVWDYYNNYSRYNNDTTLVIVTARPEKYQLQTSEWITNVLKAKSHTRLYMRPNGDKRHSPELKSDIINNLSKEGPIIKVFDDRPDVIAVLKRQGYDAMLLDGDNFSPLEPLNDYISRTVDLDRESERLGRIQCAAAEVPDPVQLAVESGAFALHPVAATLAKMSETFQERNAVYGNSATKVGEVMRVLFPDGYTCRTEADHRMMDHFNRVIAKLVRFVNSGMTHADSIHDLAVYAAMCEVEACNHNIDTNPDFL